MQPITKDQITIIGTICSRLNIVGENKKVMVAGFSATGKESTKELLYDEAKDFIKHLRDLQGPTDQDTKKAKMIGKIFYYAHEMGWTKINAAGKTVADGKKVDEWMLANSYLKKKLNRYKYSELPKLVSQFEMVYKHFLNKI